MDYGDYSTTSYGAQGGANGGGFMPGSQEQTTSTKRDYGKDTLRPVTIRQIHLATQSTPDSPFVLDGSECTQITFVGQIMNISHQATNVLYKYDDGTGQIDVKMWVDPGIDPEDPNSVYGRLKEGMLARCWGKIQVYGKKSVLAHIARPIPDPNERDYHLLEATAVHLALTRGPPGGGGQTNGAAKSNGVNGGTMGGDDKAVMLRGVSQSARKVFDCLYNTPQMREGVHMQDLGMRLKMNTLDVLKAGEELTEAGLIYATEDDHTWAVC